jgi:tetratricopeptide (TPR) repeat protein
MKCLVFVLMAAAASAQPYELGLTLQSGGERKVYRGWPLIVRGTALWTHDAEDGEEGGPEGVKLNAGAASLALYNAGGAEVELPLRPAAAAEESAQLDAQRLVAEAVWVLEGGVALPAGRYAARFSWGDAEAVIVEFEVAEPPGELSRAEQILLARLRSEARRLAGDPDGALHAVEEALGRNPDSIALQTQKAVVQAEAGQLGEALATLSAAMELFEQQSPRPSHPPAEILEIRRRIWARLLQIE